MIETDAATMMFCRLPAGERFCFADDPWKHICVKCEEAGRSYRVVTISGESQECEVDDVSAPVYIIREQFLVPPHLMGRWSEKNGAGKVYSNGDDATDGDNCRCQWCQLRRKSHLDVGWQQLSQMERASQARLLAMHWKERAFYWKKRAGE